MAENPFRQLRVYRNASSIGRKVTDCYRLMYNKELWIKAYAKLYPNARNLTKGTAEETIDGFSLQKINNIIEQLRAGTFRFAPVNRVYNSKTNHRKRPLGVPKYRGELVQEVMRMILDNIYEPVFSSNSHGFREEKNCETALLQIKNTWKGLTWCIEGDIKVFFDSIEHQILIKIISKKIDDRRFLLLLHNALKCGVMQDWKFNKTYIGRSQGGILSPLLANIYLHEFDQFMEEQMKKFDNQKFQPTSIETRALKLNRKIKYVRYVDNFVIGIAGNREHAIRIKELAGEFLERELAIELSEEKTLVTHLAKPIPFLGYEFRKSQELKIKRVKYKNHRQRFKERTLVSEIKLEIPSKKIKDIALKNNYGNLDNFKITHRTKLINNSELEILMTYNAELRGVANYYKMANNYHYLNKLFYLAESSFIKTIANKRRSTSAKVINSMRKHKQGILCLVRHDKKGNKILYQFVRLKDIQKAKGAIKTDQIQSDTMPTTF